MRIGIVTDVHDDVTHLAGALTSLRAESVDAVVSLGDVTDLFGHWEGAVEIAALLQEHSVRCVWGNHDYGLCRNVSVETRERFPTSTLNVMAAVEPRLVIDGCHFSHVEPWLVPEKPDELWSFDGVPESPDRLRKSFSAVPHRVSAIGHFHRWLAATEQGQVAWDGSTPLVFEPHERYLIVVAPIFRGAYAILDTNLWTLHPRRC